MDKILNYIKVTKNLSTSGQPTKKQFRTIAKNGFDVVINLALYNSNNAIKEEDKIVSENGMIYYHIPISWEKPEIKRLKLFLSTLQMLLSENKKVYVHCVKNYRVSVFIYKYKKDILKRKGVRLIAPKEYKPNSTWRKLLKAKV
jgi:protein tyrosine phosphatase (PTP) superfamily phosphohydrolase (DUF442 family)